MANGIQNWDDYQNNPYKPALYYPSQQATPAQVALAAPAAATPADVQQPQIIPQGAGGTGGDATALSAIKTAGGVLSDIYGIVQGERQWGMQQDQWGMQKKAMTQNYIAQQRALDRQKRIRDLMMFGSAGPKTGYQVKQA